MKTGLRGLLLAKAITASACGTAGEIADPARDLGACQTEGQVDHAEAAPFVAGVARWLEVRGAGSANLADRAAPLDDVRNVSIELLVADVGPDTPTRTEAVTIHNTMLPAIEWSTTNAGTVHLGLGLGGDGREEVLLTLVTDAGGLHFFAGNCQFEGLTSPLQTQLKDRYDEAMDQLIGMTDEKEILQLLAPQVTPAPPGPPILDPEDTDLAVLESLEVITLAIDVPPDWAGPYTICSAIEEGWNDCLDARAAAGHTSLVTAYYGDEKQLQVWLLDENATLSAPLQLLGTVDLSAVANEVLGHPSGALVQLSLAGKPSDPSVEDPIADPSVSIGASQSFRWLFAHPHRGANLFGTDIVDLDPSGVVP